LTVKNFQVEIDCKKFPGGSQLQNVQFLTVAKSPVKELHLMQKLQSLKLINCQIMKLDRLDRIPFLTLKDCYRLMDLGDLGSGNLVVHIIGCDKINEILLVNFSFYDKLRKTVPCFKLKPIVRP
jgi:hypothetical protein